MYRVGIDIGGTFTDFVVLNEAGGAVFSSKVLSTPDDLTRGVMSALDEFFGKNKRPEDITFLFHATTVATNALLERKGAKTWLCITEGYTGVYETPELGETRSATYDYLSYPKPPMLVRQRETIQIPERIDAKGQVLRRLDEAETRKRIARLKGSGVESVAVSLIFSFMNPGHEERVRELIHEVLPDVQVYLSCETLPQIREYPRLTTTVVNAYVAPVVNRYIHGLEEALKSRRITKPLYIMQSNGGSLTGGALRNIPVRMIESGPAAGVLGAAHIGRMTGQLKIISFDMGGTTAKAGIVEEGEPRIVPRFQAGDWLISTPSIDLVEIGAGGSSIAWIDKSGLVKVGPHSAGADPGPACYPNGGELPTVTDADVALGWLNPEFFVGGKFQLDRTAAELAIAKQIAKPLNLDPIEAANGIVKIVSSGMVEALRLVTVSRGEDPREYIMVAFGGAGPVHAALLAQELKIPRVLVPASPGVHSAMGLLVSDLKRDYVQTHFSLLDDVDVAEVGRRFEGMEKLAQEEFDCQGIRPEQIVHERAIDLRYSIQKYELPVPVARRGLTAAVKAAWRGMFDETHEKHFGSRAEDQKVELVNYRLTTKVIVPKPVVTEMAPIETVRGDAIKARRRAYFEGWRETPIYDRDKLMAGNRIDGPSIIEQMDSTTVVHPGMTAEIDRYGNIVIDINGEKK